MNLSMLTAKELVDYFEPETDRERIVFDKLSHFVAAHVDEEVYDQEIFDLEDKINDQDEELESLNRDVNELLEVIKELDSDNEILDRF